MPSLRFLVLLLAAAAVCVSHSAPTDSNHDVTTVPATQTSYAEIVQNSESQDVDDDDDDDDDVDVNTVIDGVPVKYLTYDELVDLINDEDNLVMSELDIVAIRQVIQARLAKNITPQGGRQKRWVPLAMRLFQAGRALFTGSRAGRVTSSGSRITRQYDRPGNYNDAVRDFNRFNPQNQGTFSGPINGRTGTVGNHKITVRDGSSNGSPTLEIRSPKGDGTFVRKFRYTE
ncbi:uncharacterized protein LOC131939984 [Physella acuta]|uniref:uncharacterized protein LOC131939984 n=1 Tax=Physella acuta TaxID=109671 RepID=UPI0027DC2069|nr:uncharacterized protein LOC131939984 [Physella acuta]